MSTTVRASILVVFFLVVLSAIFFILRPDSPAAEPQAKAFELRIRDEAMTPEEIEVRQGDRVTLRVESDAPAEVHVHGYDLEREVEPGETARISFMADITGRFDIEAHSTDADEHGDSHEHEGGHSHGGAAGHGDDHSHSGETVTGTLTVLPR